MLDHAQRAIREVDPKATIVMGGMKTGPENAINYIKEVQKTLGGRLPVDALACHPYGRYVKFAPFNNPQIGPLSTRWPIQESIPQAAAVDHRDRHAGR